MNDGGGAALSINNSSPGSAHKTLTNPSSSRDGSRQWAEQMLLLLQLFRHTAGSSVTVTMVIPALPRKTDHLT